MSISITRLIFLLVVTAIFGAIIALWIKPVLAKIRNLVGLDGKLVRFATWLQEKGIIVGQTISAIVIAFGLFFFSDFATELIPKDSAYFSLIRYVVFGFSVVAAIVQIVLAWAQAKYTKRLSKIELEKEKYKTAYEESISDFETTCRGLNLNLALELGVPANGDSDRITIYAKDIEYFVPVGRYSRNPVHDEKGDHLFRVDFGCIARTWEHGEYFDNDFPDPVTDLPEYKRKQRTYGLRAEQVDRMKMKSRLYFGWRVLNNSGDKPIAVIIVESTDPNRWTEGYLHEFFEAKKIALRPTIERVSKYIGKPSIASEEDY